MPASLSTSALQGRLRQFLSAVPSNYDTYVSLELEWPSLSLQWTKQQQQQQCTAQGGDYSLLLGTQTDGQEPNQVLLLPTRLPSDHYQRAPDDAQQQLLLGPARAVPAVPADADVNRAVALPSAPHLVATCSDTPAVALLRLDQALDGQPPEAYTTTCPLKAGSFALAWHPNVEDVPASSAQLLSGDIQGHLVLLDGNLSKLRAWQLPGGAINSVAWQHTSRHLAAAAMSDGALQVMDSRQKAPGSSVLCLSAPSNGSSGSSSSSSSRSENLDVLAVEFDPFSDSQLAAGAEDGAMCVFDLRRPQQPLLRVVKHAGGVTCMSWSKLTRGALATGGADGYVLLWDVDAAAGGQGASSGAEAGTHPGPSSSGHVPRQQHLPLLPGRPDAPPMEPPSSRATRGGSMDGSRAGASGGTPAQAAAVSGSSPSAAASVARSQLAGLTQELQQLLDPGLLFVHAGHMAPVTGVEWHPEVQGVLASVSYGTEQTAGNRLVQGNIVQVWRPSLVLNALPS